MDPSAPWLVAALYLFTGVCKAREPMSVQAFDPKPAVESFDESIVSWLARWADVELDPTLVSPEIQIPRYKFNSLIDAVRPRQSDVSATFNSNRDLNGFGSNRETQFSVASKPVTIRCSATKSHQTNAPKCADLRGSIAQRRASHYFITTSSRYHVCNYSPLGSRPRCFMRCKQISNRSCPKNGSP